MGNEIYDPEDTSNLQDVDAMDNAKRVFGYFDEHPEVGLMGCGAITTAGIIGMIVYGAKLKRA